MSFPRYPEYKDSGVEWLGEVPGYWELVRYKYVFNEKSSIAGTALPPGSISFGRVVFKDGEFLHEPTKASYQEVLAGEFLINPINLNYDLKSLRTALSEIDTCVSPAYIVLQTKITSDTSYLKYQLHVFDLFHMKTLGAGVRQTITFSDIGGCFSCRPPFSEQTQIAAFLDRETAKIDDLVAEQRRLMDLLKEKRQAVISHAVTRGLNPDAPMKPSGIEWLGDVPAHWNIVPLKRVVEVRDGTHTTPQYVDPTDDTFPLITSKDFGETTICFDEAKHISAEDHFEVVKRSNTKKGDVLMSMIGGNIGKALIVETERGFSIKNVALFKTNQSACLAKYMLYYLQSGLLDIQIALLGRGGAQGFLGLGDLRNLVFFKIPPTEMQLLVQDLESRLIPFNDLNRSAEECFLLLQERRTALISAAVTGQIDVRQT